MKRLRIPPFAAIAMHAAKHRTAKPPMASSLSHPAISHETIYVHVWRNKRPGADLWRHLRQTFKRRKRYRTRDPEKLVYVHKLGCERGDRTEEAIIDPFATASDAMLSSSNGLALTGADRDAKKYRSRSEGTQPSASGAASELGAATGAP